MIDRTAAVEAAWFERRWFMHRSHRLRALRDLVASEQNHRCCYCGWRTDDAGHPDDQPTLEHIIPRSRGGRDVYANVVMACFLCNTTRGTMRAGDAVRLIAETVARV